MLHTLVVALCVVAPVSAIAPAAASAAATIFALNAAAIVLADAPSTPLALTGRSSMT